MDEALVRDVFGLDCRIVPDPVAGTPLCISIGRKGARSLAAAAPDPEAIADSIPIDRTSQQP